MFIHLKFNYEVSVFANYSGGNRKEIGVMGPIFSELMLL